MTLSQCLVFWNNYNVVQYMHIYIFLQLCNSHTQVINNTHQLQNALLSCMVCQIKVILFCVNTLHKQSMQIRLSLLHIPNRNR